MLKNKNNQNQKKKSQSAPQQRKKKQQQGQKTARIGATVSIRAANAPVASAAVMEVSGQGNLCKFRVSERIASVEVLPDTPTGLPLLQMLLNPQTWAGSRISQEAKLWQKFRFTRLSIHAVSGVPTICSGQYVHGADSEAENMNFTGDNLITYLSNLPGAKFAPVWKETGVRCPVEAYQRSQMWYNLEMSNPSLPDYCQGLYIFALAQPFSGVSTGAGGYTIWADGEVEFCGRRISEIPTPDANSIIIHAGTEYHLGCGGGSVPYNEAGRYYFTSGVNDVDSTAVGFAYVIEPQNTFPAMMDKATNAPTFAAACRRGPGNGNSYFYRTLAGALAGDAADILDAMPTTEISVYTTAAGFLPPVKLPAGAPTFRSLAKFGQPGVKAAQQAKPSAGAASTADVISGVLSGLAALGLLSLGSADKSASDDSAGSAVGHA